jgi:peptidoglycan/LPS O-acetylase OafA/YrhL
METSLTDFAKAGVTLGRQPGLDGIRGLAILAVIGYEAQWLPGGFFGVEIFFALSGFLITTLLLEEHYESGRIALGRFFARRALRLYPALVCLVAVSTAYTLVVHPETPPAQALGIAAAVLLYSANWPRLADINGWFGGMPHTWSLAIEAQFYVFWAVVLVVVARRYARSHDREAMLKTLLIITVTILAISASWRAVMWANGAEWWRTYLGTDTRLDGVFMGATAALIRIRGLQSSKPVWLFQLGRSATSLVEAGCAAVLLFLLTALPRDTGLPGTVGFLLASTATSILILTAVARPDSFFSSVFRLPLMVWVGQISYSLYIWHLPVERLVRSERLVAVGLSPGAVHVLFVVLTFILGVISYHVIERPFLRLKRRFESAEPTPDRVIGSNAFQQAGL